MISGALFFNGMMVPQRWRLSITIKEVVFMRPKNPSHPGEMLLEEFLKPMGTSQRAFAIKLGWTPAKLNELITGKRGITTESALDLSAALKTSPELWMNLQNAWDLKKAENKRKSA
jgi:addiction module HigA family antidote